jgi:hypothetical protein
MARDGRHGGSDLTRRLDSDEQLERTTIGRPMSPATAGPALTPPTREDVWRQISLHTDLYKHYLELVLKFTAFYFVLTGAIVSFYLSRSNPGVLRFSLLLPIFLGCALALICVWGGFLNLNTRRYFVEANRSLGFTTWPEVSVLSAALWLCALVFSLVSAALVIVLCLGDRLFVGVNR